MRGSCLGLEQVCKKEQELRGLAVSGKGGWGVGGGGVGVGEEGWF